MEPSDENSDLKDSLEVEVQGIRIDVPLDERKYLSTLIVVAECSWSSFKADVL
jgi:hypothetical protein